ncbi:MAG TPA: helix-turn-helix transcriptional regulator [Flavobacteriales bacterium]|nr:helix-turn-helix transcriptional regulator [Flavobacteriales bacterium]
MTKCKICRVLGRNIYAQRVAYRFTQEYLAHEAGISQGTFCKVEKGEIELRVEAALRIARLLGRTIEELSSPQMVVKSLEDRMRRAG